MLTDFRGDEAKKKIGKKKIKMANSRTLTPCLSLLDFWNIECHSIFFQFQTRKKIRLRNKLDFFSSSNLIFTACVACKNQFRTWNKIQLVLNSIFSEFEIKSEIQNSKIDTAWDFQLPQFSIFFRKQFMDWLVLGLVGILDAKGNGHWCKGHWCARCLNLYSWETDWCKHKYRQKNDFFCVCLYLGCFWAYIEQATTI